MEDFIFLCSILYFLQFRLLPKLYGVPHYCTENLILLIFRFTLDKAWFSVASATSDSLLSVDKMCWQVFSRQNNFVLCTQAVVKNEF